MTKRSFCFTALLTFIPLSLSAQQEAPKLADGQEKWVKFYAKQNPPKPSSMLVNTDPEPRLNDGVIELCNGKDLSNWTSFGGKHQFKLLEGKIIEGTCVPGQASAYLSTNNNYKDFVFSCDIKWLEDMNTGVLFRSQSFTQKGKKGKTSVSAKGPQAEMEGFTKPDRHWSGGIYRQSCGGWTYPLWLEAHEDARKAITKEGWNRITIQAEGDTVKTWVNGVPAAHWKDGEFLEGFFSLQVHSGKGGKVQFRNPRVIELNKK